MNLFIQLSRIIAAKGSPQFRADADTKERITYQSQQSIMKNNIKGMLSFQLSLDFYFVMQWIFTRLDTTFS
jgi:hypothetical protein